MSIKITGLKELQGKLTDLGNRAKQLDGVHKVPVSELLTPGFLQGCSRFSSVDELFEESGFTVESTEDLNAIPDDQWDTYIRGNTSFDDWDAMLGAATTAWTKQQLGL